MPEAPQKLNSLPPVATPEGEPILQGRLKSPGDLVSQHETLYMADLESSLMRTLAQEQRDGVPPYSVAREKALGLSGRANVNWGMLDHTATEAEAPYNDILEGIDEFCTMPTNYGNESSRIEWEMVMADEISRMLRSWPRFYPLWQGNVRIFVGEGLSFTFFDDDHDWRWEVKGQQEIKFPRRVDADINTLDIITSRIEMLPHKLFEHCQNKEVAIESGWNPDEVWKAIVRCAGQQGIRGNDLQEWEMAWKNNDLILGTSNLTVPCVVGWIRELDGSASHYIAPADAGDIETENFLYKSIGKYRRLSNMIQPYFYGVGTNGTFHSIRGIYQKAFASCSGINRALNRMLDMAIHGSTPWITTEDEDAITELPIMPMGQYGLLKPGAKFVEAKVAPFEQTLIPAMNYLQQMFQMRTGSFTAAGGDSKAGSATKYEKQMQMEAQGKLSTSGMNLFKACWTQHLKEVIRRVCRENYASNEPGGEEVTSFRARCIARGVPPKAISMVDIDRIEVNLGLGKGSAQERKTVVDTLNSLLFYRLDEEGKARLNNYTAAAYAGTRIANILAPIKQGQRPPSDVEFANLENFVLSSGGQMQVLPNQNHLIHAQQHTRQMTQINDTLTQGQGKLQDIIPQLQNIQAHTAEHMEKVDLQDPQVSTLRSVQNSLNEVISNGVKQLYAEQEKMEREMAHNAPAASPDPNVSGPMADENGQPTQGGASPADGGEAAQSPSGRLLMQAAQVQQRARDMNFMTQQKMQNKQAEFQQKLALKDAETAAKIARGGK